MAHKILTTRNVTGVTYRIDEILTADQQAEVLSDIIHRLFLNGIGAFKSYEAINFALTQGTIVEGQFVLYSTDGLEFSVVVAKYRNIE